MRHDGRIETGEYTEIEYHQFNQSRGMRVAFGLAGVLTWPLTIPLALLSRLSDIVFVTCSQFFALFPYVVGTIFRYEFYRFSLTHCGRNVFIGFGTVFLYRDISIGDNVLIGMYNVVHHCDFGSYVLTAEGCKFLSGSRYHNSEKIDVPMALQGGKIKRIRIEDDVWLGVNSVVMDDIASGSIVAAGSVVTKPVGPRTVVAGVPARLVKYRGSPSEDGRDASPSV